MFVGQVTALGRELTVGNPMDCDRLVLCHMGCVLVANLALGISIMDKMAVAQSFAWDTLLPGVSSRPNLILMPVDCLCFAIYAHNRLSY